MLDNQSCLYPSVTLKERDKTSLTLEHTLAILSDTIQLIYIKNTIFKDELLYNPLDLDISTILKEYTNKLIETLDLPEMQITDVEDKDNLLETLDVEVPAALESTTTNALLEKTLETT